MEACGFDFSGRECCVSSPFYWLVAASAPSDGYKTVPRSAPTQSTFSSTSNKLGHKSANGYIHHPAQAGTVQCRGRSFRQRFIPKRYPAINELFAYPTANVRSMYGSLARFVDLKRRPSVADVPAGQDQFQVPLTQGKNSRRLRKDRSGAHISWPGSVFRKSHELEELHHLIVVM